MFFTAVMGVSLLFSGGAYLSRWSSRRAGPPGHECPGYESNEKPAEAGSERLVFSGPLESRDHSGSSVMELLVLDVGDMVRQALGVEGEDGILVLPEKMPVQPAGLIQPRGAGAL